MRNTQVCLWLGKCEQDLQSGHSASSSVVVVVVVVVVLCFVVVSNDLSQ